MLIEQGSYYLVNFDSWVIMPDGKQYKAAYGMCKTVNAADVLGFEPRRATNWFIQIYGPSEEYQIVAGCHVHYFHKSDSIPAKIKWGDIGGLEGSDTESIYFFR